MHESTSVLVAEARYRRYGDNSNDSASATTTAWPCTGNGLAPQQLPPVTPGPSRRSQAKRLLLGQGRRAMLMLPPSQVVAASSCCYCRLRAMLLLPPGQSCCSQAKLLPPLGHAACTAGTKLLLLGKVAAASGPCRCYRRPNKFVAPGQSCCRLRAMLPLPPPGHMLLLPPGHMLLLPPGHMPLLPRGQAPAPASRAKLLLPPGQCVATGTVIEVAATRSALSTVKHSGSAIGRVAAFSLKQMGHKTQDPPRILRRTRPVRLTLNMCRHSP